MKRRLHVLIVLSIFGVCYPSAFADVLRYTDSAGKTHYVDSVEKVPDAYRSQLENAKPLPSISTVDSPNRPAYYEQTFTPPTTKRSRKQVEVYVTSWCRYCRQLEAFLNEKRIRYARYDIEQDLEAKQRYDEYGGNGVPFTRIGDSSIAGYSPDGIMKALGKH